MSLPVLDELEALGVKVIPDGPDLVIQPASRCPPELKARLRAEKAEVLATLRAQPRVLNPLDDPLVQEFIKRFDAEVEAVTPCPPPPGALRWKQ